MSDAEITIALNTVWVLVAGTLVLFMQAGFALLEAGMTRMKNAAHVAGKNVVIFAVCALVYWAVGFGMAFGDASGDTPGWLASLVGTSGFVPSTDALTAIGGGPFSFFSGIPAAAGWFFQVTFAGVSLAIVWGAMAERARLWVYVAFGITFTLAYSVVSHWIWHGDGWLFARGMQDFAGSTVVHLQGAVAALAGAMLLGPRLGRFTRDGDRTVQSPIPGHSMPFAVLGALILWVGWMGFNAGSTGGVELGGLGFAGYVALTTNLGAAAGLVGGLIAARLLHRTADMGTLLNGVIAALVAITAGCGFVAPWAAIVIGLVAAVLANLAIPLVARLGIDDPIGAVAVHGLAGVWGTLAVGLFAMPSLAERLGTGTGGLIYTGSFHQLGVQALGIAVVATFTFATSYGALWTMRALVGIRVDAQVEHVGLDISEHGSSGYPELLSGSAMQAREAAAFHEHDTPRERLLPL
ncbi:MAG: ammonium transporter [Thermoleophilia bacterium]|nr:ammonium transporter [Thermoleophilia bacterium]